MADCVLRQSRLAFIKQYKTHPGSKSKIWKYFQGRRQLPKSGGAQFPMLLDSNHKAHFLGMHIYTILKVQLPNYLSTPT